MINRSLQNIVGNAASRLDIKKTLEMYRANIKKDTESPVQYEFAMLMINTARDATPDSGLEPGELISEAKHILQRLADRAYPFAQYYLGDGYFTGLFNKDKPDFEKAFSLFIAASKHGHAEASYRVALCYEFGWGTTKSYPKAVQFFRTSAAKVTRSTLLFVVHRLMLLYGSSPRSGTMKSSKTPRRVKTSPSIGGLRERHWISLAKVREAMRDVSHIS